MSLLPEPQPSEDHCAADILCRQLHLTFRQGEILHWVAEGKTNQEIAIILQCSVNTVKSHLKVIFSHLGLHSRTAAAACAYRAHIRNGISQNDPPIRVIPTTNDSP